MSSSTNPRKAGQNPEKDATEGVPQYGFQDPTGEFPRKKYWRGSSINRAARGVGQPNDLTVSGTFSQVDLELEETQPSVYPYNQVKETYSGHVIEYDDTAGGERILIKHRTGAGVEIRPDGTVFISSTANSLQTVGKDMKVIVEGDTQLAYKGDVDMFVEGNFNVDVGGDYNIKTKGHKREKVAKNHRTQVSGSNELVVKESNATKVVGANVDVCLDNREIITKNQLNIHTDGGTELVTDDTMLISGGAEAVMVSKTTNISGIHTSVLGVTGAIGGSGMDYTGKSYAGPLGPVPFTSGAAFYGSFLGQSIEALGALSAFTAATAGTAASLGPGGVGYPVTPKIVPVPPTSPVPPIAPIVGAHLAGGSYSIKTVTVDAGGVLKSKILKSDTYGGVFADGEPDTQDLRSGMRNPEYRDQLLGNGQSDGKISKDGTVDVPDGFGRTDGKDPSSIFGKNPLGNTRDNEGKLITRGADIFTQDEELEAERDRLSTGPVPTEDSA